MNAWSRSTAETAVRGQLACLPGACPVAGLDRRLDGLAGERLDHEKYPLRWKGNLTRFPYRYHGTRCHRHSAVVQSHQ